MDRAAAGRGGKGAVKDRQMVFPEVGRALDGAVLVDVLHEAVDLRRRVAEAGQGARHRIVDDLQAAAADELLVFHQRQVGLEPVVSQSIMNAMVPVGANRVTCALR